MKKMMFAMILLIGTLASARSMLSPEAFIASQVSMDATLNSKVATAIRIHIGGGRLSQFSIDRSSIKCLAVAASELSGSSGGVCTLSASAFQVWAKVAIVKGENGISAKVIFADVE